ncbi:DNA directed RNA polymeras-like protein III subunit Rpc82 [Clathrospora elynae]|uniref:DNA-directed RNA polymerase III subunit RPC3 n=1 Tax=Clathrospora elynae TaxID=706981 RepID=A0A6A5SAV1_9PLEO|nr:DNA directed RNA polymeras-like protein III subunit Rpc82 [Clathrospora elynae]
MAYTQRETPVLAELCTFLVEDIYGELAARVYSILARYGRQTLAAVARASYLSGRQIKYGLVILLQQHLVFHSGNDAPTTYYEIDWQNSYAIVRFGKVTKLVEDRFGRKAANVMTNLLALGHTRIADLKEAYFPTATESDDDSDDGTANGTGSKRKRANGAQVNGAATRKNGVPAELSDAKPDSAVVANGDGMTNGDHKPSKANGVTHNAAPDHAVQEQGADEITSVDELYDLIELLIKRGWVRTVNETQYMSPGDMHDMFQQEAIEQDNNGATPTGTKDRDLVHRGIIDRKRAMRDEWLKVPRFARTGRPNSSNKRVKMNGANGWAASSAPSSDDDLVIRVNPEKIAVAMRTEQLVHLVEQRLGYLTARIYQTMLRMLESNIPRCWDEWPEPSLPGGEPGAENGIDPHFLVTARDVATKLSREMDIFEGLDPNAVVQITRKGHVHRTNILSQPIDPSRLSLDEKTMVVDKHIQLLSEDPLHFVTWHSRAGFSQWHIEFEEIAKQMIQTEVENTISSRKGSLGVKLIRTLRKKGKLDERAACNTMMMSANDIRGIVNDLTIQGFVQTQEIPKVDRREAKHSLHLVWYDRQRAREKLLHDTYKGMVRILQRIAYERGKVQPTLEKAERSDVVGKEEQYLSKGEVDTLKKWKEVQEKLLLQLFREDDLVATLRDFHGPLISV